MFGLLNINKPKGLTSRDVVNRVQRIVRGVKVGHAGTLDPLATGVLVVGMGPATRLVEYVQRMRKRYLGTFLLGRTSDTEDVEGDVVVLDTPPRPTREQIEAVLPDFVGEISQLPPAFSALKVQGRRAYDLARRGEQVKLEPRSVAVHDVQLRRYDYPQLCLEIECGSGTYIRSLGRDLAEQLGTSAVMAALERTAIGDFRIERASTLDQINAETISQHLLPPRLAVAELPSVGLNDEEIRRIGNGMTVDNRWRVGGPEVAALDGQGRLLAILAPRQQRLGPLRNFPAASDRSD
jgi:tRNA pseudouridine55 synthase